MKEAEKTNKTKKQIPLRLSPTLYAQLMEWAEADFRSLNGQIEYLLTECVRRRKGEKEDKLHILYSTMSDIIL